MVRPAVPVSIISRRASGLQGVDHRNCGVSLWSGPTWPEGDKGADYADVTAEMVCPLVAFRAD